MKRAATRDCGPHVRGRVDFNSHGTLKGFHGNNGYEVLSYATVIARYDPDGEFGPVWYLAKAKHSATTTRHQNLVSYWLTNWRTKEVESL